MRTFHLVVAVGVIAPACAQVPTAIAISMANAMAEEAAQMAREAQLQAMDWKKLEKIQNRLLQHMKDMNKAKQALTTEVGKAKEEKAAIRKQRGADPAKWPPEVRERDQRCDEVVKNAEGAMAQLSEAAKFAGQVNGSIGKMDRATFRQFAPQLHQRVLQIQQMLQRVGNGVGAATVFDNSKADPITLVNQSSSMTFFVGTVEVKPGSEVKVPFTSTLVVRALGWTARRKLIDERIKKPVGSARITKPDFYEFQYEVGSSRAASNSTTWLSEKESYTWTGPTMVLKTSGPFEPGKATFATGKRTNDTCTWQVPDVSKSRFGSGAGGIQTLQFLVRGEVDWRVTRSGEVSNASQKESERFDGVLLVKLTPR